MKKHTPAQRGDRDLSLPAVAHRLARLVDDIDRNPDRASDVQWMALLEAAVDAFSAVVREPLFGAGLRQLSVIARQHLRFQEIAEKSLKDGDALDALFTIVLDRVSPMTEGERRAGAVR
jgi:hypothetical protein